MELDHTNHKLLIQHECQHETVQHHRISILEPATLNAVYPADMPNLCVAIIVIVVSCLINASYFSFSLQSSPKVFSQIVSYFQANEEEMTIDIDNGKIVVQNYVGDFEMEGFVRSRVQFK